MSQKSLSFSMMLAATLIFASTLVIPNTFGRAQAAPTAPVATPVGTGFTYQGYLKKAGAPVNATCNFHFSIWDAATGGNEYNSGQDATLAVQDGLFTAVLNPNNEFAGAIDGSQRWIQTAVQCPGDANPTTLSRQPILACPMPLGWCPAPVCLAQSTTPLCLGSTMRLNWQRGLG